MHVDLQLLPAINKIVSGCEVHLSKLIGIPVKLKLQVTPAELNETTIQTLVCDEFNVNWHQVISTTRKAEAATARHVYWWLCWKWLGKNYSQIAKDFDRDHTSILHGKKKIDKLISVKDIFMTAKIKKIEKVIEDNIKD